MFDGYAEPDLMDSDTMASYHDLKEFISNELRNVSGRGKSKRIEMFKQLDRVLDLACGVAVEVSGYALDEVSDKLLAELYLELS